MIKSYKKEISIITLCFILLFSSACGDVAPADSSQATPTPTPTPEKPVHIGVSLHNYDDNYFSFVAETITMMADEDTALTADIKDAIGDRNLQMSQISALLTGGAAALAVSLVDIDDARAVCDIAATEEIPVAFLGAQPDMAIIAEYPNAWYVGTNAESGGTVQGELIAEHFNGNIIDDRNSDGKLQLIILTGEDDSLLSDTRLSALTTSAQSSATIDVLASETANWSFAEAEDLTEQLLNEFPNAEAFAALSDSMALGVVAALDESEIKYAVYGIDAIPQAVEAINSGGLTGTVYDNPDTLASVATELLTNIVRDKDALEDIQSTATFSDNSVLLNYEAIDNF